MKKIFLCALVLGLAGGTGITAKAQQAVCIAQTPKVIVGGKINSATLGSGSATAAAATTYNAASFPLYSKIDTFTGSNSDTMAFNVVGTCNSVYTWTHITSIAGTNTTVVVKLWQSPDNVGWDAVQSTTVSATPQHISYSATGNPAGYYKWTVGSGATQTSSWYSGLKVR
jgi:hypothetical protein